MTTSSYITIPLIPPSNEGVPLTDAKPFSSLENLTPKDLIRPGRFNTCAIEYLQFHATLQKSDLEWKAIWNNTLKYLLGKGWNGYALERLIHEFFFNASAESQIGLFTAIKDFEPTLSFAIPNLDLIKLFWTSDWQAVLSALHQIPKSNNFLWQIDIIAKIELGRTQGHFENSEKSTTFLIRTFSSLDQTQLIALGYLCNDFEKFASYKSLGRASLTHSFPVICNYYFAKNMHPLTQHSFILYPLVLPATATQAFNPQPTNNSQFISTQPDHPPPQHQLPPPGATDPTPNTTQFPPQVSSQTQNPITPNPFANNPILSLAFSQAKRVEPVSQAVLLKPALKYPLNFDSPFLISLKKELPTLTCSNLRNVLYEYFYKLNGLQDFQVLNFEEVARDFWIILNSHFLQSPNYKQYYAILSGLGSDLTLSPKMFMALFKALVFREDTNKIKFLFSEDSNVQNSLSFFWNKQLDKLTSSMESIPVGMRSLEHLNFWLFGIIFNDKAKWRGHTQPTKQALIKKYQLKEPLTDKQVSVIERFCANPEKLGWYTKKHFKQIAALIPLLASWAYYIQQSTKFEYEPPFNFVLGLEIADIFAKKLNCQTDYQAIATKLSEVLPVSNKGKK